MFLCEHAEQLGSSVSDVQERFERLVDSLTEGVEVRSKGRKLLLHCVSLKRIKLEFVYVLVAGTSEEREVGAYRTEALPTSGDEGVNSLDNVVPLGPSGNKVVQVSLDGGDVHI